MSVPAADDAPRRCGLVAIVGRPNVGKSTLLNALVGQKISITSRKAQTTRHRITGIRTVGAAQFVFVDTPGFQMKHGTALHRTLNRTVLSSLSEVDVVLFVVEAGRFGLDDAKVLALLPPGKPVLLVANKLDAVKRRNDMLPWLKSMQERHAFAEFVPMSAQQGRRRAAAVRDPRAVPARRPVASRGGCAHRSQRPLPGQRAHPREAVPPDRRRTALQLHGADRQVRGGGQPAPDRRQHHRRARRAQGHGGRLPAASGSSASAARRARSSSSLLGAKVFLELWVKVRSGWADDEAHLRSFGYE